MNPDNTQEILDAAHKLADSVPGTFSLMKEDLHRIEELGIVAKMVANKRERHVHALNFSIYDHLRCMSWWQSPKLFFLYQFLIAMDENEETDGIWRRLKTYGDELIAKEKTSEK